MILPADETVTGFAPGHQVSNGIKSGLSYWGKGFQREKIVWAKAQSQGSFELTKNIKKFNVPKIQYRADY